MSYQVASLHLYAIILEFYIIQDVQMCTLPADLIGQWTDVTKNGITVTFTSTQLTGWSIRVTGEPMNSHTCISNTANVYVFRGDKEYTNFPATYPYYLCLKLTQVSSNIFYYYLLGDKNPSAEQERIYMPLNRPDDSTTPTCDYCQFTNLIPDDDFRELRRSGTTETITVNPTICLPCASTCGEISTIESLTNSDVTTSTAIPVVTTQQEITTEDILTTNHVVTNKLETTKEDILTTTSDISTKLKPTTKEVFTSATVPSCTLPSALLGQWTDVSKSGITVTFTSNKLTGWTLRVTGELMNSHTCISNIGNVYVFRGDKEYADPPSTYPYYLCMKLTQVSSNIFYYYLLGDKNPNAELERIFTPLNRPDDSIAPTCDYCQFTNSIPDSDYHELKRLGQTETLTISPTLCLPCASTCDETSTTEQVISTDVTTPATTPVTITLETTTEGVSTLASVPRCTLPSDLLGQWTDVSKGGITVTFTSRKLTGWTIRVTGETMNSHTCISNIGNVYVFRGDKEYTNFPYTRPYYLCMKLTQVSGDIFYYYLLGDRNLIAEDERLYTPVLRPDDSTTPTCDYCQFTSVIPDTDFRELRKLGSISNPQVNPTLCLPCAATCDETTTKRQITSTDVITLSEVMTTNVSIETYTFDRVTTVTSTIPQESKTKITTTDKSILSSGLPTNQTDVETSILTEQSPLSTTKQPTTTSPFQSTDKELSTPINYSQSLVTEMSTTNPKSTSTESSTVTKQLQTTMATNSFTIRKNSAPAESVQTTKDFTVTMKLETTPKSTTFHQTSTISTLTSTSTSTIQTGSSQHSNVQQTATKTATSTKLVTPNPSGLEADNEPVLTDTSILLITSSSVAGVLLGLAIITLALCLIRNKTLKNMGRHRRQNSLSKSRNQYRRRRGRETSYFSPFGEDTHVV